MVPLTPDLLQAVTKPARYTGNEWNMSRKRHEDVACTFALSMPDVYEVGMSNLGLKILYEILNRREDTAAERVYAPWIDMEAEMRKRGLPLFSLETRTPIREFDFLGFSLQYEMIYTNVLNMLDLAGIPAYAVERDEDAPFVVGGGPCVYNVEPVADFFDLFVIGEGDGKMKDGPRAGRDFCVVPPGFRAFTCLLFIRRVTLTGILQGWSRLARMCPLSFTNVRCVTWTKWRQWKIR